MSNESELAERLRRAHHKQADIVARNATFQKQREEDLRALRLRREALHTDASQCVVAGDEHNLARDLARLVERIESVSWTEIITTLSERFGVPRHVIESEVVAVRGMLRKSF